MSRVLETVLTGRNLLSPMLASASKDVVAFNSTVAGANEKAAASAAASAKVQQTAATSSAEASGKASTAASLGAGRQAAAADKIAISNVKASTSATASSQAQVRAHSSAAESATVSARVQETANRSLAASNGLLGTSLTPVTAGLGAVGLGLAYAGFRGMEFGTAMSQVQAATQASTGTMHDLSDAAIEWGAKTQYSSVEAAQGITEIAKAGVATTDILHGGLAGALNLAAAGQMEVADAAEIGATAMNVFNLKGDQMSHVADLLAAGAGKAQGSVYDLGQALNQSALVASATGLSIEETAGSLALFASQGLVGSDAGTSFRQMLLHLQNPSKEAAGTMADLGINMYDANGAFVGMENLAGQLQTRMSGLTQQQRDQAMATIFGSDAVRASNILYEAGAQGITEWTNKVNDAGYAQKQATQLTDNLRGDLERLGGSFDSLMTTIGGGTQGALREVVQMLGFLVNTGGDVLGFFTSLPGPVQAAVLGIGAFVALRGPLAAFFTMLEVKAVLGASSFLQMALSANTLKAGIVGVTLAAAAWGISKAAGEVMDMAHAGERASDSVDAFSDSLDGLTKAEKLSALRGELEKTQAVLDGFDNQNWFDKAIWQNPFDSDASEIQTARDKAEELRSKIEEIEHTNESTAGSFSGLRDAIGATVTQTQEAKNALQDWMEALQEVETAFVDPLAVYQGLLEEKTASERESAEATAAATESGKDSWKDYVGSVSVSLDEYADKLEEQLENQDNWHANLVTVAQRAGLDVAQALQQMGADGVQLTADMANGTDAEMQRMAALIREDARRGGNDAALALDNGLKVMAIVGRDGAAATRAAIADELGIGVSQVQAIADQYGVALATGINPVLSSIGKKVITINQKAGRRYIGLNEYDVGGYTGPGAKLDPAGVVHRGEIVWSQDDIAAHGGVDRVESMRTARKGYADGGFVTAADVPHPYSTSPYQPPISAGADGVMQKGFDEVRAWLQENASVGPTAGSGVQRWLPVVLQSLSMVAQPASLAQTVLRRMQQESGGNPTIVNRWDSNWAKGTPSVGLMQVIGPTYRANADPRRNVGPYLYGTSVDPLANILASEHYAMKRYGSLSAAYNKAGGYDSGGLATSAGLLAKGTVQPERVLSPRQTEAFERWMATAPAAMPGYGSAGGWGGGAPARPVVVSLAGATVTGRFEFGSDGLVRLIDGRIDGAFQEAHDDQHYYR